MSVCDVPGCGADRLRRHRLCSRCFAKLPGEIRVGLKEAHYQRRWSDWRALKKRAATFFNLDRSEALCPTHRPAITTQRAYELTARMLGERIDA